MELNQGWFFIYDLRKEWIDFIKENEKNINYIRQKFSDYKTYQKNTSLQEIINSVITNETTKETINDLTWFRSVIEIKKKYDRGYSNFHTFLKFDKEGWIDVDKITEAFFRKIFLDNIKIDEFSDSLDTDFNNVKEFLEIYLALDNIIRLFNKTSDEDPSKSKLSFENIEIYLFDDLIKTKNKLNELNNSKEKRINERITKFQEKSTSHIQILSKLRKENLDKLSVKK